jgi:basic amino acid/polyamine antiporter, APA family
MAKKQDKGELKRDLRLLDAIGIGLGAIIGAGIFVVTGVAAGVAGPSFLIGLFLAGIVATFNALSSAQLAATYPQSGGTYEYGYQVLNPWLGFAAGWVFLASKLAAAGTVALGFASYFTALFPIASERMMAVIAAIILTVVNYFGIRRTGNLNTFIVLISVASLALFILAGIPSIRSENLVPFAPQGWRGTLEATALLFFAYTGYARLATLGEEVHEPKKTIPRAIVWALGIAAILYLGVAYVAVGSVGSETMAGSNSPLEAAARTFPFPWVAVLVGIGATTAMLGVLLSQLLGISRMIFAMSRRKDMPVIFNHVNPEHGVPDRGILLAGAVAILVALFGTFKAIVAAAAFTILIYYSIANLAAIRMRKEDKLFPNWIPIAGFISCILLASTMPINVIIIGLGLLAAGFLGRVVYRHLIHPDER